MKTLIQKIKNCFTKNYWSKLSNKKTEDICVHCIGNGIKTKPNDVMTDLGKLIGDALDLNIRWSNIKDKVNNPDGDIGYFTITKRI